MIALVLAMVWSRRGQALTLALLSLLGVTAAVAAPAYLRATDRAVAAAQVADASVAERSFVLTQTQPDNRGRAEGQPPPPPGLDANRSVLLDLPEFRYVYAAAYASVGIDPDDRFRTLFVHRQEVCGHVTVVAGRCLIGEGDVIVGSRTAERFGIAPGDSVTLAYAELLGRPPHYVARGAPKRLLVTGTYRVTDAGEPYWGASAYFTGSAEHPGEPVFVTSATMEAMDHGLTWLSIDGVAAPGALTVDRLPAVQAGLSALRSQVTTLGSPVDVDTALPDLLARIDSGRTAAHLVVPVLAVALVLLACMTIFLAVGYGTEARRPELAVVALRGARRGQRWWLATGENLVAIVAGAVAGCLTGQLLVNAVAAWRFPGVGADAGLASLRYAPIAGLAAVLTAVLAQRRQIVSPVTELLRRAPTVPGIAGAVAVLAAVTVLAGLAGAQLFLTGGTLAGTGTFAAALIIIAGAQLAARALLPAVTRYATRALRRGRAGVALAGFQLSRRPGAARLFALLVAAVAVAGYAACATDVAGRGRILQAQVGTGADRVLTVSPMVRSELFAAVRAVDPAGAYAMAAVRLPTDPGQPTGLAVDTTRLASVATWSGSAAALRPSAPVPVTVDGLALDVSADGLRESKPVSLGAVVSSTAGLGDAVVPLGTILAGRHTYRQPVPVCRQGCVLKAVRLSEGGGVLDVEGRLTLHGVGAAESGRWRASAGGTLSVVPDGLRIDITSLNGLSDGLLLQPAVTPYPVPAVTAGTTGLSVKGLDGRPLPLTPVRSLPAVPGLGTPAVLVDLAYADALATDNGVTDRGQVWLSAAAPADVRERLADRGVAVLAETRAAQVQRRLDQQGPALALVFYVLVGVLAVALAAGALILAAVVDRDRRVEDLSALRIQGLRRSALRQATLWTYPALIAGATVAGLGIALLTWWLTGWALPLAGLDPPPLPLPGWPRPAVFAAIGVAVGAVLIAVAYVAGRRTLSRASADSGGWS